MEKDLGDRVSSSILPQSCNQTNVISLLGESQVETTPGELSHKKRLYLQQIWRP